MAKLMTRTRNWMWATYSEAVVTDIYYERLHHVRKKWWNLEFRTNRLYVIAGMDVPETLKLENRLTLNDHYCYVLFWNGENYKARRVASCVVAFNKPHIRVQHVDY